MKLDAVILRETRNIKTHVACSHFSVGTKLYVHIDLECKIIDIGYRKWWERGRRGVTDEKLLTGYNVHYLGNEYTRSPNLRTTPYIHICICCVAQLHLYHLNLYK